MRPKGIRKAGMAAHHPSMGYTGISIDILSTISADMNAIKESVEVTKPTAPKETIIETVVVAVTP